MKSKFDAQVEALKKKCEKKECISNNGEPGKSPFSLDVLDALILSKFKTPTMNPYDGFEGLRWALWGSHRLPGSIDAIKYRAIQIALIGSA